MGNYNAGDLLTLNFMPAGASNLPIRFLLIPESLANPQKHQTIAVNVPKDVKDSLGHPTQGGYANSCRSYQVVKIAIKVL